MNEQHEHRSGDYLFGADWRTQERYTKDCDVCREALRLERLARRRLAAELNMLDFIERADVYSSDNPDMGELREAIEARRSLSMSLMYALAVYNEIHGTDYLRVSEMFEAQ